MEKYPFPSFNHPFYPDGGHQQSFIDYGSVSTLNIDTDTDGRLVTTSRHRHYDAESQRGCLVAAHLTLPLLPPCKAVLSDNVFPEQRNRSFNRTDFKQSLVEQTSNFCRDHPDTAFPFSMEFIEEEFHCTPWDENCFYYPKRLQAHLSDLYKRQRINPNNDLDRFCDLFVAFPLSKDLGFMVEQKHILPKGLCEAILDVPPKLIFDHLNESIEQKKDEMLYFDILQGNTIAYCNMLDHELGGDGILFCPSGPSMEVLNANVVRLEDPENSSAETRTSYGKPVFLPSSKSIEVNGPIRQISAVSYEYGDTFVASRSRYNCSFFSITTATTNNSPEITINAIDSLDKENQVMSLAISPYIPGEGIVAMETGQVYLWHHGKEVETRDVPSVAPKENWPWYQCIFAAHPRCILIANSVEADILDLRASGSFSRNLFSINSKQVSTLERISAIQLHPQNTHHYFIATDQSLLIMDDRFIQHPVLKWRHHLQDPAQHIEVITNAIPDCEDTVVVISGSQHHESHCFQYCSGEHEVRHTFPLSGDSVVNPPSSTVLPWKVSSYDEWLSLVPTSILPISSVLKDRLANPLIGVCCIPLKNQDTKGLTVLQMSSSGDIFYQPFKSKDRSREGYPKNVETSKNSKNVSNDVITFLNSWIDELVELDSKKEYNEWPLKSNMVKTNCRDLFGEMKCLDEPHPLCTLCVYDAINRNAAIQDEHENDEEEESVCPRCGIDVEYGRQFKKCRTINIPCSKEIKSEVQCKDLNLLTNTDSYDDPFSTALSQNWLSDTPIPLNLENTDEKDKETEVPVTKTDAKMISEDNIDHTTTEIKNKEISKSGDEILDKPNECPNLDSPMKTSLEVPMLRTIKDSEPFPSPSKVANSPVKQVKGTKRKLNQSMGF